MNFCIVYLCRSNDSLDIYVYILLLMLGFYFINRKPCSNKANITLAKSKHMVCCRAGSTDEDSDEVPCMGNPNLDTANWWYSCIFDTICLALFDSSWTGIWDNRFSVWG